MKFTPGNTKISIVVKNNEDITVEFLHRKQWMGWKPVTLQQRAELVSLTARWIIAMEIRGPEGLLGSHEVKIHTPCTFNEVNGVLKQLIDAAAAECEVITSLNATITIAA